MKMMMIEIGTMCRLTLKYKQGKNVHILEIEGSL